MAWRQAQPTPPDTNPANTFDPEIHPRLTAGLVGNDLLTHDFVVARTMPQWPHEYIVRKDWRGLIPWENVAQFMRDHGVRGYFGAGRHRPRHYFRFGGMRYWTMGNPLIETTIINRDEDVPVPYLRLEGDPENHHPVRPPPA